MAGKVFARAGARMSVMWHLAVDHEVVGPAYADMRTAYEGPVTIAQDLTTFDLSADAVVTRQSTIDPARWPVLGPTVVTGPPMIAAAPAARVVGRRAHRPTDDRTAMPRHALSHAAVSAISALLARQEPPRDPS